MASGSGGITPHSSNLDLRKTIYSTSAALPTARAITPQEAQQTIQANAAKDAATASSSTGGTGGAKLSYSCETCGTDCTRVRYHSLKDGKYTICSACYTSGRFPSTMYSGGFVRMDDEAFRHASGANTSDWSDQETLLLLEGIEMHDDDWNKVSEHVGTRSKDQCILHFLQLPIEDSYLADSDAQLGPLKHAASIAGGGSALPFSRVDNPVMSVVAFLAGAVSPGVAAAAAQRALGELTKGLRKRNGVEKIVEEIPEEKDGEEKTEKDDAMQVDDEKVEKPEAAEETVAPADSMEVDATTNVASAEEPAGPEDAVPATTAAESSTAPATTNGTNGTIPQSEIERIATLALGSAAAKASVLATHEERRIETLVTRLVSAQMKKLELKMTMFEKFEEMLEQEKRQIEIQKQQFYKEKLTLQGQLGIVQNLLEKAKAQGQANGEMKQRADAVDRTISSAAAQAMKETTVEGNAGVEVPQDGQSNLATIG